MAQTDTTPGRAETIGFIGAGMMGQGMCENLLKAGHTLNVVAHRNRAPIEALVAQGAREAGSVGDLIANSGVVMICVNSADTVAEIVETHIDRFARGTLVIDTTTSLPEVSRRLGALLAPRGIGFADAPVIGGPAQAKAATLGTFIGADPEHIDRVRAITSRYSEQVEHFGGVGAGNTAKLLNNYLTVGLRQLVTHAFRAARRNDVDVQKFFELTMRGAAGSRILEQFGSGLAEGDYTRNKFSIANCHKDMSYVGGLLADDPDATAVQQAMTSAYARLIEAGFGDRFASEMLDPDVEAGMKPR